MTPRPRRILMLPAAALALTIAALPATADPVADEGPVPGLEDVLEALEARGRDVAGLRVRLDDLRRDWSALSRQAADLRELAVSAEAAAGALRRDLAAAGGLPIAAPAGPSPFTSPAPSSGGMSGGLAGLLSGMGGGGGGGLDPDALGKLLQGPDGKPHPLAGLLSPKGPGGGPNPLAGLLKSLGGSGGKNPLADLLKGGGGGGGANPLSALLQGAGGGAAAAPRAAPSAAKGPAKKSPLDSLSNLLPMLSASGMDVSGIKAEIDGMRPDLARLEELRASIAADKAAGKEADPASVEEARALGASVQPRIAELAAKLQGDFARMQGGGK